MKFLLNGSVFFLESYYSHTNVGFYQLLAAVNPNVRYHTRRHMQAMSTPPSYRKLMEANGTSKGTVQRILATSSSSYVPPGPRGRPATLTHSEEAAVAAYVMWMEKSGFPAEKSQVEEAALSFLTARNIPNAKIGKM